MNIYRSQAKHLLQSRKLNGLAVAVICTVNKGLFLFSEHKCVNVSYANIPVNLACSPEPTGKGNVKQLVRHCTTQQKDRSCSKPKSILKGRQNVLQMEGKTEAN